jgi:hypothetical protein
MNPYRDLLAEIELTMVPSLTRPPDPGAHPLAAFSETAPRGGSRRRHFWCARKEQEVEVEFATRSPLPWSRIVGVTRCTAFDRPDDVACGRHCVEARFRRQWPPALPVVDRRRSAEA